MSNRLSRINWHTAVFLVVTFLVAAIGVPLYAWRYGLTWFDFGHFVVMAYLTGLSITVGYHRLWAHRSFDAAWPVRLFTLIFGAAAFENSVLMWASEHRYHHKHTDQEGDPYDPYNIKKGFFHAHVGWLLEKMTPALSRDNVADLEKDPLLRWQDRYIYWLATVFGLGLPALVGLLYASWQGTSLAAGALGGFLIGGVARVVVVHHCTFFINSLCHYMGRQPYDSSQSSRDSGILAFFTFGEGYHNYHHTFQNDYRNGVKPWHWDPGKWVIWLLSKVGLARRLRRVPRETIWLAEIKQNRRQLEERIAAARADLAQQVAAMLGSAEESLERAHLQLRVLLSEYRRVASSKLTASQARLREIKRDLQAARREFRDLLRQWKATHRRVRRLAQEAG